VLNRTKEYFTRNFRPIFYFKRTMECFARNFLPKYDKGIRNFLTLSCEIQQEQPASNHDSNIQNNSIESFSQFVEDKRSRAWDSATSGRWTAATRGITRFPSGGPFLRVRFHDSRAVERSHAWDFAIPERWTTPARGISQFLSGGPFQRVRFHDSRA